MKSCSALLPAAFAEKPMPKRPTPFWPATYPVEKQPPVLVLDRHSEPSPKLMNASPLRATAIEFA